MNNNLFKTFIVVKFILVVFNPLWYFVKLFLAWYFSVFLARSVADFVFCFFAINVCPAQKLTTPMVKTGREIVNLLSE